MAQYQQHQEEIPLLSSDERHAAHTDTDVPAATGVRQRTFKDAAVNPPPYGQGSGPSAPIPGSNTGSSLSGGHAGSSGLGGGNTGSSGSALSGDSKGAASSLGQSGSSAGSSSGGKRGAIVGRAEADVKGVVNITRSGVASGAWLYPVRGVVYLLTHPNLLFPLLPTLLKAAAGSVLVLIGCFFFFYLPQVAFLALFTGPLAFLGAIPLVLGEAYLIITWASKAFLLGDVADDLFDAVLVNKGCGRLVEANRPVKSWSGGKVLGKLASRTMKKLSTDNVVRYLLTLPLNFIPVVGTAFFLGYNGYKSGPSYQRRYFELKGWGAGETEQFVQKRRPAYAAFGTAAMVFNLVPVVSVLLNLAANVGAALWAADLENGRASGDDVLDVALPPGQYLKDSSKEGQKKEL